MTRYIKKKKQLPMNFNIVYDDREKRPWTFLEKDYGVMKKKRLKCGDYSIEGYEDCIAIEKKSGVGELFANLTGRYRETFKRFLKRLSKYPVKCIIVENGFSDSNINSVLYTLRKKSKNRLQLSDDTMYYWVSEIMCKYSIPILFVDKRTMKKVLPFVFESAYRIAIAIKDK